MGSEGVEGRCPSVYTEAKGKAVEILDSNVKETFEIYTYSLGSIFAFHVNEETAGRELLEVGKDVSAAAGRKSHTWPQRSVIFSVVNEFIYETLSAWSLKKKFNPISQMEPAARSLSRGVRSRANIDSQNAKTSWPQRS